MARHDVVPAIKNGELMATISVYWNARYKRWDLVIASKGQSQHWSWYLTADTTVEMDAGTGWLLLKAVQEALEAQLY